MNVWGEIVQIYFCYVQLFLFCFFFYRVKSELMMNSVVIQQFKNIPLEKGQIKKCYFSISFRLLLARSLRLIASCELWNHFRPTHPLSEVYD